MISSKKQHYSPERDTGAFTRKDFGAATSKTQSPKRRLLPFEFTHSPALANWWTLELLAYGGSLASIIVIFAILSHYDNRPQPEWPDNINLNSIISWFTTIMKALMLVPIAACIGQANWNHFHSKPHALIDTSVYDSASRGPAGAIQLLCYFRLKSVQTASSAQAKQMRRYRQVLRALLAARRPTPELMAACRVSLPPHLPHRLTLVDIWAKWQSLC